MQVKGGHEPPRIVDRCAGGELPPSPRGSWRSYNVGALPVCTPGRDACAAW